MDKEKNTNKLPELQDKTAVPFFVYETEVARNERTTKRLIIALVIAIILIFASNAAWLYAWTQYDYTSEEVTYSQDGEGINNINTGEQGDINNGPDVHSEEENEEEEGRV